MTGAVDLSVAGEQPEPETPPPTIERLIASMDWSRTSLGPAETWPASLRTVLRLMLTSRYSMWLGWGNELLFFCNESYREQTLGAKYPWAIGRPAREVWSEIWDVLESRIHHVLNTGEATWDEGLLLFLERSGYPEETYHSFSYSPAPDDATGQIGGLFCVVVEETERVLGERRIALLGRFAALLAVAKTPADVFAALETCLATDARDVPFSLTYLVDGGGSRVERASMTGFSEAHPAAPVSSSIDGALPWPLESVLSSGEPLVFELDAEQPWPLGAWRIAASRALLVPFARQGESRPAGVFIAGLNPHRLLDARLRDFLGLLVGQLGAGLSNAGAYEAERKRAEALAEIDRAKTVFFSNVSHEFRTPLTLMLAPIDDMRAVPARDRQERERIELLHRNALRLLKLVNTLLEFSRIEAGRVEAAYEPTDLAALTVDLASSFRAAIERAGLRLVVDCPSLSQAIFVDPIMWEKIVLNLLSNAFKFTFAGSISVRLRELEGAAVLSVSDTGTGIAESDLPRLFERFHRIEGARSRSHEGSGIGLALVHELVRMHGGELEVQSRLGEGTTFSIRVPKGTSHLAQERIRAERRLQPTVTGVGAYVEEALSWGPSSDHEPSSLFGQTRRQAPPTAERIVVADDNADMRTYITRLLTERWRVETFSDGQQALEAMRQDPPDLVVSDVMMPRLDGYGLIRAMRADPVLRAIPIVLLSARAGEEATTEGLNAGADDYIVKPFSTRDFLVRITARIAAARSARAIEEQRKRLYRIFMRAPFAVAILRDAELVLELANDVILESWGKGADVIGLPFRRALPEISGLAFYDALDSVYRTGVAREGHAELARLPRGEDGALQDTYWDYQYVPLFAANGSVEGVMVCGFDVTEQVTARRDAEALAARLSVTTERLTAAQRVAGVGLFDWDMQRQNVHWSAELCALMGMDAVATDVPAELWQQCVIEEDRELGWNAFHDATIARKDTMEVELRLRQPEGSSRWVRLSTLIFYDSAGEARRAIGAVVDVQVLKEAAQAKADALQEAERVGRAKDEFLATMSHELRTPLNAILGWSRILKNDQPDPTKLSKGLAVIERNALTQTRLVNDLLDVSRIISGKLLLSLQRVEVSTVIDAAIDVVKPAADAKGLSIRKLIDADVGAVIADPDRLQQIIWNLLTNAVRFTPSGSVTVTAQRSDSNVRIVFEDTGTGIPSQHLPHIFERFRQVDASTTRLHGGLGLGLAIVRYLAEAHGGTVKAKSDGPGTGAEFTVVLPVRAVVPASADVVRPAVAERPTSMSAVSLQGVRVLVVDDDADSLELVREVLQGAGASFHGASSALEAITAPGSFDLIISDIGMPHMDGYTFMSRIRSQATGADVPAIALTAYARAEDAQRALRAGYQEHIAKPVDAVALLAAVKRWTRAPRSTEPG